MATGHGARHPPLLIAKRRKRRQGGNPPRRHRLCVFHSAGGRPEAGSTLL